MVDPKSTEMINSSASLTGWSDYQLNLNQIWENNSFQRKYFPELKNWRSWNGWDDFSKYAPLTTKQALDEDRQANPPYGSNFTYSLDQYSRYSRTSGTSGKSMTWLDTQKDWEWMLDNWSNIMKEAGVKSGSSCFFAFSFGPFLGFWTAYEAAVRKGCLCIPGGGESSKSRIRTILDDKVEYLFCTPTYALRLVETARENKISLHKNSLKKIIVAGESGGSSPAIRLMMDQAWGKESIFFDHYGMTEVGPVAYENPQQSGLRILTGSYFAEVIHCQNLSPVEDGEVGELVLTPLQRIGSPVIRYRTGDLVRVKRGTDSAGAPTFDLIGGVLGRADDMVVVRGVNLYPSAVDNIVRSICGIGEYEVSISESRGMKEIGIKAECHQSVGLQLEEALHDAFLLRIPVECVANQSLPRAETKSKRWTLQNKK
jgi:phenylacetate-CoA ligase